VGLVVDKVALGQLFFEYFGLAFQLSLHRLLHTHHHHLYHPELVQEAK
jgi:hypothetical protein